MISAGDLRKGTKILFREEPHTVVDFHHNKMGRGGAIIRVKLKSLITGSSFEETFRSTEKFLQPNLERKEMQYLYDDNGLYHFMDQKTFEQTSLEKELIDEVHAYLKEQEMYQMTYFKDKPIGVTPPMFLSLKVTHTQPGVKGDTAQGAGNKPATLETGLVVQVPLFVNEGDLVKIDTRDGSYIERA